MATNAMAAQGTVLKRGNGAGTEVFTTVAEITDFTGPGISLATIDASHLGSNYVEKLAGLIDSGEFSFNANFIGGDLQHQGLVNDQDDRVLRNFQLELPDGTDFAFAAYVTNFAISGAAGQKVSGAITLTISGAVAVTYPL